MVDEPPAPPTTGRGRFIAFEGGEGSGKSTQARRLAQFLDAVLTREPGGTEVGAQLRAILLDPATTGLSSRAEALLMAADRAQHVREVVEPALAAGRHVVTDRFAGSSIAYQGYGRGLDPDEVRRLSEWATDGVWPDLVVLLDLDASIASTRLGSRPDRFEEEGADFHERVTAGFRALAAAEPERLGRRGRRRELWPRWARPCAPRSPSGYNSGHDRDRPGTRRRPAASIRGRPSSDRIGRSPSCRRRRGRPCTPTCWWGRGAAASGRWRWPSPPSC